MNPVVPVRIRRLLNVESGLNDGIATPFVLVAVAGAGFSGGLAFGAIGGHRGERMMPFVEETGALVSLLVWLAFGAIAVAPASRA